MKKRFIILITGLTILMLMGTSTGLVFAIESVLQKNTISSDESMLQSQTDSQADMIENKTARIGSLEKIALAPVSTDSNLRQLTNAQPTTSAINATTLFYSTTEKSAYFSRSLDADCYDIIPVKAKNTGIMYMDVKSFGGYGGFSLCDSLPDTNNVDWDCFVLGTESSPYGMPVTAGNTYYILAGNDENSSTISVGVRAYIYTTTERALPQGASKWTLASVQNRSGNVSTTYFKVKPDRTGRMKVSLNEFDSECPSHGYVTLYNSSKKALSKGVFYNSSSSSDRVYFGVKKNTTYYLKVTDCDGNVKQKKFGIKYTMSTATDRALSSRSRAKKLIRKANATNTLFTASSSTNTDWCKIYVSSKRKTTIRINTESIKSGNVYVTVYKGSKKLGSETIKANIKQTDLKLTYGTTTGKANSGTYSIKLVKGTKASGKYTIRYLY